MFATRCMLALTSIATSMTEQELREEIERYKRLLNATSDQAVHNVLLSLIAEAERKLQSVPPRVADHC